MDKYQYQWEWVPGVGFILSMAVVVLLGWITGDKDKVSTSSPTPGGLGESIGRQIIPSPEPTPSVTPSPLVTPTPESFYSPFVTPSPETPYASPSPSATPTPPVTYSAPESSPQGSESFSTPSRVQAVIEDDTYPLNTQGEEETSSTSIKIMNGLDHPVIMNIKLEGDNLLDEAIFRDIPIEAGRGKIIRNVKGPGFMALDFAPDIPGFQYSEYNLKPGCNYRLIMGYSLLFSNKTVIQTEITNPSLMCPP